MSGAPYPIRKEENLVFTFTSTGPKGRIEKLVRYDPIDEETFNLGFGDRIDGSFDFNDNVVTDNGDIRKVLVTVIATLEIFFETYPKKWVHIQGSDETRTRMYLRIIKNNMALYKDKYRVPGW